MPSFVERLVRGVLLLGPLVLTACATPSTGSAGVPDDGIIAAAVVVGSELGHEIERRPGRWPVEMRPARAIILPDGSLRADVGPSLGIEDRPGVTRHLRRPQLADLWRRMDELGFGDEVAGNFTGNPKLIQLGPREVLQLLEFRRDDVDWMIVDRFEVPEGAETTSSGKSSDVDRAALDNPRMRAAIRAIAALAWASDVPPDDTVRFPERYDFGPDPWARYRSAPEATSAETAP